MVITESSLSDPINDVKDLLITVAYTAIVDKVVEVLGNYPCYAQNFATKLKASQSNIINQRSLCLQKVIKAIE